VKLRDVVAAAIREAAADNPYCSVVPGPVVAGCYAADAALGVVVDLADEGRLLKSLMSGEVSG
jgi:hypothetical protein